MTLFHLLLSSSFSRSEWLNVFALAKKKEREGKKEILIKHKHSSVDKLFNEMFVFQWIVITLNGLKPFHSKINEKNDTKSGFSIK